MKQVKRGKTLIKRAKDYFENGGGWTRRRLAKQDGTCCLIGGLVVAGGIPLAEIVDCDSPSMQQETLLDGAYDDAIRRIADAIVEVSPNSPAAQELRRLLQPNPIYRYGGSPMSKADVTRNMRNIIMQWNDASRNYKRVGQVLDAALA